MCRAKLDRFLDTPSYTSEYCKDAAYAPFPELQKLHALAQRKRAKTAATTVRTRWRDQIETERSKVNSGVEVNRP